MRRIHCSLIVATGILPVLSGCDTSHADASREKPPAAIVIVSHPVQETITDYVDFTGRTDAVESVEIRARVTGFLKKVHFKDGAEVKAGELLYQIDDREYQADLDTASAELAMGLAQQVKATTDLKRTTALRDKGSVSAEEFDRTDAAKKEADAAVESAKAKQDRARLNVEFSTITAPIAGKISRTEVTEGNLIRADSTLLTTLVSVDPINANFDLDERTLLTVRKRMREGQLKVESEEEKIPVEMGLATDEGYPKHGIVDFIDNRVNPATGTIRLRGVFSNPEFQPQRREMAPGLFARIRVPLGEPHPALLVTDRAIGTDQGQKFVYVVDGKNEVVFRAVKLGSVQNGLRVIAEGLSSSDSIIIDGLQRVRPGSEVTPKPGDMRGRPGEAAVASEMSGRESGLAETTGTSKSKSAE
jgi:RND family efflux transporter MFP subunit